MVRAIQARVREGPFYSLQPPHATRRPKADAGRADRADPKRPGVPTDGTPRCDVPLLQDARGSARNRLFARLHAERLRSLTRPVEGTRCELNPGKDLAFGNVVVRSYIELLVYEPALHLNTCSRARTCEASPRPAMMLATGRQTRRSPKNALAPPLWPTRSARIRRAPQNSSLTCPPTFVFSYGA
jgi:hypothetical protein